MVTAYEPALRVLKDARFSAERLTPMLRDLPADLRAEVPDLTRALSRWVLVLDPPDHTRIRGLMNHAFTPRAVEAMRPRITALVEGLLARVAPRRRMDAIHDFAYPLPASVIADMIGVPHEDQDRFKAWSDDIAAFVGSFSIDPATLRRGQAGLVAMRDYFRGLIAERRRAPRDDLLTAFIQARDGAAQLTEDELIANAGFLLFAGHETTTNLIGNGLLHLLRRPDEWARLVRSPELVPSAVEEMLRFDGPVDRISRIATVDLDLEGMAVKKGDRVVVLTGAANRDPARFPDPDRFDVGRPNNQHLAFGVGPHFCIGGPLARVEAQVALRRLVGLAPHLQLEPQSIEWNDLVGFRGLRALHVRW